MLYSASKTNVSAPEYGQLGDGQTTYKQLLDCTMFMLGSLHLVF